jgi:hypothetical protein
MSRLFQFLYAVSAFVLNNKRMPELFENKPPEKRSKTGLLIGVVIAIALLGIGAFLLSRIPPREDQTAKMLEGALTQGPEFDALSKQIMIARDDNRTVESPTGGGSISMFIFGTVYNRTGKRIATLQVDVSVINQQNQPIKSKKVVVVPLQQPPIDVGGTAPITCTLDGFDRKDDRANINFKVTAIKVES